MKMSHKNYLTMREVAERLGVTKGRVSHFVSSGDLPYHHRFGQQLAFERSVVEKFARIPRKLGRPKKTFPSPKKAVDKA